MASAIADALEEAVPAIVKQVGDAEQRRREQEARERIERRRRQARERAEARQRARQAAKEELKSIVKVTENAHNAAHPEDWFVTTEESWEVVATLDESALSGLIETPRNLWLQAKKSTDRVSAEFIAASAEHQSIFLIKPTNLRLRLWREYNSWKGYIQKKLRVIFDYNGTTYDLSLTDPVASQKYAKTFPAEDEPAIEVTLPQGDNYVLCVSLTPALNGIHYKVVATILDLP